MKLKLLTRLFAVPLACALLITPWVAGFSSPLSGTPDKESRVVRVDLSSDAALLVERVEETHPSFALDEVPAGYKAAREEYLEAAASPLSTMEFTLATQKYLASLGDGHMGYGLLRSGMYMQIGWTALNGSLYIPDVDGKPTKERVTDIGGVPAARVMATVDAYYAAENETARDRNHTVFCRQDMMLRLSGCVITDNAVTVATTAGKRTVPLLMSDMATQRNGAQPGYTMRHEMMGDVFYVDIRIFRKDAAADDTCDSVRDAVKAGVKKFIVDVRDNPGGNSGVGQELMHALGMTFPIEGMYARHSPLAEKKGGIKSDIVQPPRLKDARNLSGVQLLVLTNENTFSSATLFGVWAQDGKLGKIVGRPSSNAPTSYGDMLQTQLPVSLLIVPISWKKWYRPDPFANQNTLVPDLPVPVGEDILEAALLHMSSLYNQRT